MSGLDITFRSATAEDLEVITDISYAASRLVLPDKVLYSKLDQYQNDYRRCQWTDAHADFYTEDVVVILASTDNKVVGYATWEYNGPVTNYALPSNENSHERSHLRQLLPGQTAWRRICHVIYDTLDNIVCKCDRSQDKVVMDRISSESYSPINGTTLQDVKNFENREHWYLLDLAVNPDFQGRRIGSALLSWAFERMKIEEHDSSGKETGIPVLLKANPGTREFYHRHGFKEIGRLECGDMAWDKMVKNV